MSIFVSILILIPLFGFFVNIFLPSKKERIVSGAAFLLVGFHFIVIQVFLVTWGIMGFPLLSIKEFDIYSSGDYSFFIDLYFDEVTAVYLFVGSFLTFLVAIYSREYLHKESGFKRFYNTIMFFYLGYNLVIMAGNFETMFIGWEILGISSFLLIAFYRNRYIPVKNAFKVFSVYRIGDAALLLAMWMSHHLWHENITFEKLHNYELVHHHLQSHSIIGVLISLMILIAAAVKSAQLPFSSWLPRAMEGPTPSSAIFYGSLSVHIGVFVLLRTHPFWEQQLSIKILIGLCGIFTAIVANGIARVQSTVKSQIAYASISQIGLIFVEVALGLDYLALFHFAGNAFLRTYQLLVSPSVVSYLIREQFYNYTPREDTIEDSLPKRIEYTLYLFCLKEGYLDQFMFKFLWSPLKKMGSFLKVIHPGLIINFFGILLVFTIFIADYFTANIRSYFPLTLGIFAFLFLVKALSERGNPIYAWMLVILSHFYTVYGITFNDTITQDQTIIYLSGVIGAGVAGYICLRWFKRKEPKLDLNSFQGHVYEYRYTALFFLLCCLGLVGFPISPTFIGIDLIFSHIKEEQVLLTIVVALNYLLTGLCIIRIYARVFLGPHIKMYHEVAYRSS